MTDQRLYFMLQRAAHQLRLAADRRCVAAAGITTAQLGALYVVQDQPGVTQQGLAAALGQRESAVTAMVGRLVDAHLVTRRTHPQQHRAVALDLTPAGAEALRRVQPTVDEFNAGIRAAIGADEFDITADALRRLTDWQP